MIKVLILLISVEASRVLRWSRLLACGVRVIIPESGQTNVESVKYYHAPKVATSKETFNLLQRQQYPDTFIAEKQLFRDRCNGFRQFNAQSTLVLGSFNVKQFGQRKSSNSTILQHLALILRKYDSVSVLEVRDKTRESVLRLLTEMNKERVIYSVTIGKEQGESKYYKESVAVFYRHDKLKLVDSFNTNTGGFSREPLVTIFESLNNPAIRFMQLHVHLSPGNVFEEMSRLKETYRDLVEKYNSVSAEPLYSAMILGDFK